MEAHAQPSHVPQHIRSLFRTARNLLRMHWSGISRLAVPTFRRKLYLLLPERMSDQIWAIALGHIVIMYVRRHNVARITKFAKPVHIRCECAGELLQLPDAVGARTYQFALRDVSCLFCWVTLGSAFQATKMLPLYKRRKGNKRETKQNWSKETITGSTHWKRTLLCNM
jgi:hypothetical protein